MKVLILDSGILINLSMNGLLYIIPELKISSDVKFLITRDVKYETIDRPSNVPRFELGALRIQEMLERKEIELPDSLNISDDEINSLKDELMDEANHSLKSRDKWISIVSNAEVSCLALSSILTNKGVENIVAIDERTTRLLSEKPENLEKLMSSRLHQNIRLEKINFEKFKKFRFIRSTELVYVAFKKKILHLKNPRALEAALYATKYHGSSASFEEIEVLKKL